jgi:hypothetical protein
MIVFVTTPGHAYTHKELRGADAGLRVEIMEYRHVLTAAALPRATYVFTDFDRLSLWWLRVAADTFRLLRARGVTVINDPAQAASRFGLLRKLYRAGINRFNAYRVEEGVMPERWPVFLRCEGEHEGPKSGLIQGPDDLQREIAAVLAEGVPIVSLLIVEYAAEPLRPGFFRKYSCFRVGGRSFAHTCVDDNNWIAKIGRRDITPMELYEEEYNVVRTNPYGPDVAPAFDLAAADYGRVDFGLVGGTVQIYEVNTNPHMQFGDDHPVALRHESYRTFRDNYLGALRAIDSPDDAGSVVIR